MAKVNYGTIVNDARGKVNGTVFSKNKSGAYTRRKVTPANPNTPRQTLMRTNFGTLSQAWSGTLTDAERASWITYANTYPRIDVFGASIKITGLNMFLSLSAVMLNLVLPIVTTAPASNVVAPISFDPTSMTAVLAGLIQFQQLAAAPGANSVYYLFGQAPAPAGRQPALSAFRYLGLLAGVAGPYPAFVDITALYRAKFPTWAIGNRISVLAATANTDNGLTTVGAVMTAIST